MFSVQQTRRLLLRLAILALVIKQASAFSASSRQQRIDRFDILPPGLQEASSKGLIVQARPNVWVLGTVHIGSKSAQEATLLINSLKPTAVVAEVSPSRLKTIRARMKQRQRTGEEFPNGSEPTALLRSLLALAEKGWSTGGIGGLFFAVVVMGGSLVKRSFTANEESDTLPRVDEFEAAIIAADAMGASVVACDKEIDRLIADVTNSVSPVGWVSLGMNVAAESLGLREVDPIRRRRGESVVDWAVRRRDIATARASKRHGERMSRGLSAVLVDSRDDRFARYCGKVIEISKDISSSSSSTAAESEKEPPIVVCVVGLVHLDGVAEKLKDLSDAMYETDRD